MTVGVIDTGIQADHPDLNELQQEALPQLRHGHPGHRRRRCEYASCVDPAGEDDGGHGTHVAGTIAASLNGFGVSGVAPSVDLVEVRGGQDSGFFFLGPTVDALTYSGDAGLDVVNMSFYVDPWLYNCVGGAPEDTPEQAADQDVIIDAMTRALDYAHEQGRHPVRRARQRSRGPGQPGHRPHQPGLPAGDPHERTIDNATCFDLPTEGPHVLGVSALGPSTTKADYSNWTTEPQSGEVEVSAPGGWFRDGFGTPVLSGPRERGPFHGAAGDLQETGEVDQNGNVTPLGDERVKGVPGAPAKGRSAATSPSSRARRWPPRTPWASRTGDQRARQPGRGRFGIARTPYVTW